MNTSTERRTERIYERVVVSSLECEQYQYKDRPVLRNYKRRKREKNENGEKEEKGQIEKAESSVRRTRREIRRTVNSNPQLTKFLTLTSKITDGKKSNHCFNLFTQRMKDRYPEFQYFAVLEFQKDIDFFGNVKPDGGAAHYHLLCNLRYVRSKEIEKIWGKGFIKIKRVRHVTNLGRYLSKYLQKDMFDKRMFGKKKFFCSQELKRPVEIVNDDARVFMQENAENMEKGWETTFTSNYLGEISYAIFRLNISSA